MTRHFFLVPALVMGVLLGVTACGGGGNSNNVSRPATVSAAPAAPRIQPDALMGMDEAALERVLGLPEFRRNDAPAEIWQYAGAGCVAHLFLYADAVDLPHMVRHMEAHARDGAKIDMADCLADIEATQK